MTNSNSRTLNLLLKHWTAPLPEFFDFITFPFNVEEFCRENDQLLDEKDAAKILSAREVSIKLLRTILDAPFDSIPWREFLRRYDFISIEELLNNFMLVLAEKDAQRVVSDEELTKYYSDWVNECVNTQKICNTKVAFKDGFKKCQELMSSKPENVDTSKEHVDKHLLFKDVKPRPPQEDFFKDVPKAKHPLAETSSNKCEVKNAQALKEIEETVALNKRLREKGISPPLTSSNSEQQNLVKKASKIVNEFITLERLQAYDYRFGVLVNLIIEGLREERDQGFQDCKEAAAKVCKPPFGDNDLVKTRDCCKAVYKDAQIKIRALKPQPKGDGR